MKTLACLLLSLSLTLPSFSLAASDIVDLERRLQQQERRIDRLEREVEVLQDRLMDSQYGEASSRPATDLDRVDPLVGTWECTNNVFNYDISFFDDGQMIQEEPFFSKVRSSRWSRLSKDQIATDRGLAFKTSFRSNDRVTVTNRASKESWECLRKR
jgi:hypothetical protein